jgi:ubiquinone/menaquinone biosynthesis C-methylase UbiE
MYTIDTESTNVWDGERLETSRHDGVAIEHLHRYAITLDLVNGKYVLDLASGEGYGSNLMALVAKSVTGVDISSEAIKHAQNKYRKENLRFLIGSADKVPVESNSIDVVVSFETIEHHDKHEEMMLEIKRVLKDDGLLIISSPDKLNYSDIPEQNNPYHVKELYLEEFRELIKKHFKNSSMLLQKMVYASLISPEHSSKAFKEYSGTYASVSASSSIQSPLYNICVASDSKIGEFEASICDGKEILDRLFNIRVKQAEMQIKLSNSYKIGHLVTSPVRFIKNILRIQ